MTNLVSNETHYTVREAVLVNTPNGSAWTVRFVPQAGRPEAEEVVILIAPRDMDKMTFANAYTLRELQDFANEHHP